MYGPNPWGGWYGPPPQTMQIPVPQGTDPEKAYKLISKIMAREEKRVKKEKEEADKKKKEEPKKDDKKITRVECFAIATAVSIPYGAFLLFLIKIFGNAFYAAIK